MQTDVNDYLEVLRYENAETLPDADLCFQDSITGNMHDFIGRDLIVILFNPACGSCRQELSAVADLFLRQPGCRNDFIFILNQPERYEQARSLLDGYEFFRHEITGPVSGQQKSHSAEVTGYHPERLIKPWTR
jgi:hypothetical protein